MFGRLVLTRLVAVASVLVVAGCANAAPAPAPAPPPAASAPSPTAGPAPATPHETPAPGGVTTAAQVFGPACTAGADTAATPTNQGGATATPTVTTTPSEHGKPAERGRPGRTVKPTQTVAPTPTGTALPEQPGQPVVEAIAADPRLTTLTTVIKKADLTATLDGASGLTVFAPTDRAWAALRDLLGTQRFNELVTDQNELTELLKYQVLTERTDRAALLTAGTAETLEGGSVQVTAQPAAAPAGGSPAGAGAATLRVADAAGRTATVLCGNIPTANATVFLVDQVLLRRQP